MANQNHPNPSNLAMHPVGYPVNQCGNPIVCPHCKQDGFWDGPSNSDIPTRCPHYFCMECIIEFTQKPQLTCPLCNERWQYWLWSHHGKYQRMHLPACRLDKPSDNSDTESLYSSDSDENHTDSGSDSDCGTDSDNDEKDTDSDEKNTDEKDTDNDETTTPTTAQT